MAWNKTYVSVRGCGLTMWSEKGRARHYVYTYGPPNNPKPRYSLRMRHAANLIIGNSVLDVGCGIGHLYPHVKNKVKVYKGLDGSLEMLRLAKKHNPNIDIHVGDAYDLSKEGVYDTVIALSLLIHVPLKDVSKVVMELWKHCKKALVFSIAIKDVEGSKMVEEPYLTIITHLRIETLTKILRELNAKKVQILEVPIGAFGYGLGDYFIQAVKE